MNENELIRKLRNGKTEALKLLIEKYQDYVYTIANQIVKNAELAEEITQDVFIKVYQKIDSFEHRSKFSTWLFTITYRLSLNQVNKRKIMVSESDLVFDENGTFNGPSLNGSSQEADSRIGDFDFTQNNAQEIIWKAIDRLNRQQGLVISLFYLQQFSVAEISEILTLSVNTVKTQLFRGRNNLKTILLKNYTPEDLI